MKAIIQGIKRKIIKGTIEVPGDKSITHRAIILGSIAEGETRIQNYLDGLDCNSTITCMRSLGVQIEKTNCHLLIIKGRGLKGLQPPTDILQVGNSGTTIRLLAGLLSGQNFNTILDGDDSIRKRPMNRIIEPLSLMQAQIKGVNQGGFAPLRITGRTLVGINYTLPVASAQVKSAILLASLAARGETLIFEPEITRDHTERMLKLMGADIKILPAQKIILKPGKSLTGVLVDIPGDISSAAYFLALVAARKDSEIVVKNTGINPTRTGFLEVLKDMGANIGLLNREDISNEPRADIKINGAPLKGIVIDKKIIPRIIDELPLVAVIATQAQGKTVIKDARELRIKETDRIKSIVQGLSRMGANIYEREDGLEVIGPTQLKGEEVESFFDHRIAMSLAIAASYANGQTIINQSECIDISYPDFLKNFFRLVND
ncbi:MAG: 3-phosphoshikimate 1-carboxyvinyltransferase [Candidatus Caldatribacteriota bacterium]